METSPVLTLQLVLNAFDGPRGISNPLNQYFDWSKSVYNFPVIQPASQGYLLDPNSTTVIFNGTRTLTLDGTTAFSLTLSNIQQNRYRFTVTAGTAAGFRTNRNVNLGSISTALLLNSDGSVTVTAASGTPFASVIVGDQVFIPGLSTGDTTGPFNEINTGIWQVIGVSSSTVITMMRQTGISGGVYSAISETETPTGPNDFQVFSAAGVQIGDKVDISAGFSSVVIGNYSIIAVTATRLEVLSTQPLPTASGIIPGVAGFVVYTNGKRMVYVEVDQSAAVQCNGDTGQTQRIDPVFVNCGCKTFGSYLKTGPCWSLSLVNRTSTPMNARVISVE
jgi:hypothetical protein